MRAGRPCRSARPSDPLPEGRPDAAEQPGVLRRNLLAAQRRELAEEVLLGRVEVRRRVDDDLHEQVAPPPSLDVRDPTAPQAEDPARLGALRDDQILLAVE